MKNRFSLAPVSAAGLALSQLSAQAHPGHAPDPSTLTGQWISPDRPGLMVLAAVIGFCGWQAGRWFKRGRHHGQEESHLPGPSSLPKLAPHEAAR